MESKNLFLKKRKGSESKKYEEKHGEEVLQEKGSLWVVTAYYCSLSYILRKAKAFYQWVCNGNEEFCIENHEVTLVDPYFSIPVLPESKRASA